MFAALSLKQASNATTFKLNTQKSSFIIVLYQFKQTLNSSERGSSRELTIQVLKLWNHKIVKQNKSTDKIIFQGRHKQNHHSINQNDKTCTKYDVS